MAEKAAGRALQAIQEAVKKGVGPDLERLVDRLGGIAEAARGDQGPPAPPASLDELLEELDALIGLEPVKEQVRALVAFLQVQSLRKKQGLPEVGTSQHLAFLGNPGTGKTTVARLLARMYRAMGLLKKGHLVEVDRSGLVSQYVGMTAIKTDRVVRQARDGVLFIDEAYSLAREHSPWDYGREAVDTLLKRMEDNRERLVVIVAGYPRLMHGFLDSNPGLRSRFAREISFPDYTTAELVAILRKYCSDHRYQLAEGSEETLRRLFDGAERGEGFGNARFARNLFEWALIAQALRLADVSGGAGEGLENVSPEELTRLAPADFDTAARAVGSGEAPVKRRDSFFGRGGRGKRSQKSAERGRIA